MTAQNLMGQRIFNDVSTPAQGWNTVVEKVSNVLVTQKDKILGDDFKVEIEPNEIITTLKTGKFDSLDSDDWHYINLALQKAPSQEHDVQMFALFAQTFYGIKLAVENRGYASVSGR